MIDRNGTEYYVIVPRLDAGNLQPEKQWLIAQERQHGKPVWFTSLGFIVPQRISGAVVTRLTAGGVKHDAFWLGAMLPNGKRPIVATRHTLCELSRAEAALKDFAFYDASTDTHFGVT
jgi:hypothetical protein